MSNRDTNKHGLSRADLSAAVKRQIRQSAGFGCVNCGLAICQYEHVDPPFADAKKHDPSKMAYLCARCHDLVTRGFWSKAKVLAAMENPTCRQEGFTHSAFDIQGHPTISIGQAHFQETSTILEVEGEPVIAVKPPEDEGGPFRLSGKFCSLDGSEVL